MDRLTLSQKMAQFSSTSGKDLEAWEKGYPSNKHHPSLFPSPDVVIPLTGAPLTEYKLEKQTAQLFPDFYYQFLNNLSKHSFLHGFYCKYGFENFDKILITCKEGPKHIRTKIVADFANAFKNALGLSFEEVCKNEYFTKEFVETGFFEYLLRIKYYNYYTIRQEEVVKQALTGDFKSYIWFLKAYCHTDDAVWSQARPTLISRCLKSGELEKTFSESLEFYKKRNDTLLNNVRDFIEYYPKKYHRN